MCFFKVFIRHILILLAFTAHLGGAIAQTKATSKDEKAGTETSIEAGTKIATEEQKLAEFCAIEKNKADTRCKVLPE